MSDTQAQPGPNLYDILQKLQKQLTQQATKLEDVYREAVLTRQMLAKRRLPTARASDNPDVIVSEMITRVKDYWRDNKLPMQLHFLSRVFARRMLAFDMTSTKLPEVFYTEIKQFLAPSGGHMLIPMDAWLKVHEEQRNAWLTYTPKEIRSRNEIRRTLAEGSIPFNPANETVIPNPHSEMVPKNDLL